jgi:hypothetical protein
MIIGTITLIMLLLGGGGFSFDVFHDAAKDVIADKQIVKQIKVVTKSANKEMKAWGKDVKEISKQIAEMNRNYDLTEAEMAAYLKWTDTRRDAFQEKLIKLRFEAKNLVSRAQWEAMYAKAKI